jgi:hypothetical protein
MSLDYAQSILFLQKGENVDAKDHDLSWTRGIHEILAAGRPYFNGGADTPGDTALSQGPAEAPSDPHLVAEKGVKQ